MNWRFFNLLCLSMLLPTVILQIPVAVEGLVAGGAILLPPHRLLHQQSFLSHHCHENFGLLEKQSRQYFHIKFSGRFYLLLFDVWFQILVNWAPWLPFADKWNAGDVTIDDRTAEHNFVLRVNT